MLAQRFNRQHPLQLLGGEMDRLFPEFLGEFPWDGFAGNGGARTFPALNIWEDENNLYVEAELPGLKMDEIDLAIEGNELTLKGERKSASAEEANYHRREREYGAFGRVIRFPVEINAAKAGAQLRDGVLSVTLPKAEAAKPLKIKVKPA